MRTHESIYTERHPDAGWNVVQAATLLSEGKKRSCASLVHYAGLEMRMAIEQIFFIIISMSDRELTPVLVSECRKRNGLRRVLKEVSPDYEKRCLFMGALASVHREIPDIAVWNVGRLWKHYSKLNELCHSPLVVENMADAPDKWSVRIKVIEDAYAYLAEKMKKPTGNLSLKRASAGGSELWEQFRRGDIDLVAVRSRMHDMLRSRDEP